MKWLFGKITDPTPREYAAWEKALSPSRGARIRRLQKEEDRRRSLLATRLVHRLLTESGYPDGTLENEPDGRPYLSGCPLQVSISHCDEGVVCAVSSHAVGIDLEKLRPVPLSLIRYVCTEEEQRYILESDSAAEDGMVDGAAAHRFWSVWTAKEACFKKNGCSHADIRSIHTLTLPKHHVYVEDYVITVV